MQLWQQLERTRLLFQGQYKRFCIRRVLKSWFGLRATDDFIWEVCMLCEQEGWDELPLPSLYPRKHREFLRAIVAVRLGISFYKIDLKALDAAYSIAFPNSTPLNISKKKTPPGLRALRREWGFAPLCGAVATFSGYSKDPSRPLGGEDLQLIIDK